MSSQRVLALKFEPQLVRLVQVRLKGARILVERAEQAPTLDQLLAGAPVGAGHCVAALPREAAFSRVLHLPASDPAELRPMVELQAKSLLPYGQADVVIDFLTLQQTATHTTILLLGVTRPVVEQHLQLLHQAGMAQPALTLATSGLLHWYRVVRPQLHLAGTVALLEVDTATAECLIVTDDTLRFTRSLPVSTSAAWLEELDRTLQSYRKEEIGELPTQLVLTGDPALVAQMHGPLAEWTHLPVRTVETWLAAEPQSGLTLPPAGAWSAALGLALSHGGQPFINLLPADVRQTRARRSTHRERLVTASILAAVLWAATGWLQVETHRERALQAQLERSLKDVTPRARELAHQTQRLTRAHELLAQRGDSVLLLQELYQLTPAAVTLTQWLLETNGEVKIRGIAPALSDVLAYVNALKDSAHFQEVRLRYSAERATAGGSRVEFELSCQTTPSQRTASHPPR